MGSQMKYIIATNNADKLREMTDILSKHAIDIISPAEAGYADDVDETGETFCDNARLKAVAACKATGMPAIADDSGLVVEALGGAPGVRSKRFGGGGLSGSELCGYLLKLMEGVEQRDAKFVCAVVCAYPGGEAFSVTGECSGSIALAPRGRGGFGYDPVFIASGMDKTMAELTQEEKNAISHRGAALREFAAVFEKRAKLQEETL
jgi:XTP/dITP diphosphohydrolase